MQRHWYGTIDQQDIFLFSLENKNGMKVTLSNFGALLIGLEVPDTNGTYADIVLGYDTLEEYCVNYDFYGAVVGPHANRIENGTFLLDGITYQLDKNNGPHNLHSHRELGLHKRVWEYKELSGGIRFSVALKDGEMGFGGNKTISLTYTLTDDNALMMIYDAESDKNTPINLTNHSYFNLDGHGAGSILNHEIQIFASAYTPVDNELIPTGDILTVEGTPFDFRAMQKIGARIDGEHEQLKHGGGYDHNWCLDCYNGQIRKVAVVRNSAGTRTMEIFTDLPGAQFYTGNVMKHEKGKHGAIYDKNGGFAFETQFYPDSVNKLHFPSPIFGPNRKYHSVTIYQF